MKIAVFSENLLGILSCSGGAEVYALKLAETLMHKHQVTMFTLGNDKTQKPEDIKKKYHIISGMKIVVIPFRHSSNLIIDIPKRILLWKKLRKIVYKNYEVFINTTHNRMIGFKRVKSVHLIHFPVENYCSVLPSVIGKFMNKLYRKSYRLFLTNSEFTKFHAKKEWGVDSTVLTPPIDMETVSEEVLLKKKPYLLMVGRIVPDKRIGEIVNFFETIQNESVLKNFKLIIAGNKDNSSTDFYDELKAKEIGGRIEIYSDLPYSRLVELYKQSLIFIHAKGYKESDDNPMKMEHFGMTTVEAMANGCIPLVINKAGQIEIVEQGISGYCWNNLDELRIQLLSLLKKTQEIKKMQYSAIERSKKYLYKNFQDNIYKIFDVL